MQKHLLGFVFVLFLVHSIHSSLLLSVSSLEDGNVLCTLKNTASNPERFLQYNTPFDSGVFASILKVTDRLGKEAKYIGKVGKRVFPPPESSFLTLESGESISAVINIHELYHVHEEGIYRISGRVPEGIRAEIGESAMQYLEKSAETVKRSKAVMSNRGCSTEEQKVIEESREQAEGYTYEAFKCLDENSCDTFSTKWFSATSSQNGDNYQKVRATMSKLRPALASVNSECHSSECTPSAYAYVYPEDPEQIIYFCNVFWNPPARSEQPQTIIHEKSHFFAVAGTSDYAYGPPECLQLAVFEPDQAADNADNIGYFAVDVGETLDITYSIIVETSASPNSVSNTASNSPNSNSNNSDASIVVSPVLASFLFLVLLII